jgi:hypothetical protein
MSCASAEPAVVVHVEETITPALAGREGCTYASPPLPRAEALALVRLLIGHDGQSPDQRCWRCPIAGGQRTVTIRPVAPADPSINGGQPAIEPYHGTNMHLITTTDEKGLHVDPEQLERAGIKPGSRALVEIRPYTEEDWVADGERTFASGDEFLAYLGACPSHVEG